MNTKHSDITATVQTQVLEPRQYEDCKVGYKTRTWVGEWSVTLHTPPPLPKHRDSHDEMSS